MATKETKKPEKKPAGKAGESGSALDKLAARAAAADAKRRELIEKELQAEKGELYLPLNKLRFNPKQARRRYHTIDGKIHQDDQAYIEELAANIKSKSEREGTDGLDHAITVSEVGDGTWLIEMGECRTRAHIFLGRTEIRARINNNLKTRSSRLLAQLSENILRNDLKDWEVAQSVKELMEGDEVAGEPPMNQTEIAAALGKSEGYITRFVVFGDDELRKRWVEPGIVDTAEKLYRLKLLPEHLKLDILRRIGLDPEHRDYLPIPVKRSVIDDYAVTAKMEKNRQKTESAATKPAQAPVKAPAAPSAPPADGGSTSPTAGAGAGAAENAVAAGAGIGLAPPGQTGGAEPWPFPAGAVKGENGVHGGGYSLSEADREKLLTGMKDNKSDEPTAPRVSKPPVNCRVPLAALERLIPLLRTKPELMDSVRRVVCQVQLPEDVAQQLAGVLVGVVVDDQVLPATIQEALTGLTAEE